MSRRILSFFLALAMAGSLALTMSSCGKDTSLTVYADGDFIKQDLINAFSEETGITVNYITGTRTPPKQEEDSDASSADTSAALKEGEQSSVDILSDLRAWKEEDEAARAESSESEGVTCEYDVVLTDFDTACLLRDDGCLQELNLDTISNAKQLQRGWLTLNGEKKHHYAIPALWGTAGILWNTKQINYQVTSWKSLWRKAYRGQVIMPNNARDCASAALTLNGNPVNSTDAKEIRAAYQKLERQRPLVAGYANGLSYDLMAGGAASITLAYSGEAIELMAQNPDLAFIIPKEGTWRMCYAYCIPAGSEWSEEAAKFINYMCSASNMAKNAVYSKYSTTSPTAFKKLDKTWQKNPLAYPPSVIRRNARLIQGLDAKSEKLHARLFQRLTGQTADTKKS